MQLAQDFFPHRVVRKCQLNLNAADIYAHDDASVCKFLNLTVKPVEVAIERTAHQYTHVILVLFVRNW